MNNLITILFLVLGFSAFSQNPITTPRIKIIDRTGIDTTTVANQGQIVFDATDDKFRFNDGTGWFSFLKDGATLPYWPLSGTGLIPGSSTISFWGNTLGTIYVAPDTFAIDLSTIGGYTGPRISFSSHGLSESAGHVSIGTANQVGTDSVRLSFESFLEDAQAVFYDWRALGK